MFNDFCLLPGLLVLLLSENRIARSLYIVRGNRARM